MRIVRVTLWAFIILIGTVAPALAQKQLNTIFELSGDYTIVVPSGWTSEVSDGDGFVFNNDDSTVMVLDPVITASLLSRSSQGDVVSALISIYDGYYDERIASDDIETDEFSGYDTAFWYFTIGRNREGVFVTVEVDEETYVAFDIVTPNGDLDAALEAAEAMMQSLNGTGLTGGSSPSGSEPVTGGSSSSAGSDEPCIVSVTTANTAQLRVGPGLNRTAVAFLQPGIDFTVIGMATSDDGTEWFKLDKAEAAPSSAANEIWVQREQVDESGACDAVADAAAPPVLPITNAPPPAPPAGDSGTTSNPPSGSTTTSSGGGAVTPQAGRWTIYFDSITRFSCQGTETINVATTEVFPYTSYTVSLSVTNNGSTIIFDGDPLTWDGSIYVGSSSFDGGNGQTRIRFNSPTTLSGEIVANVSIQGTACSGTVYLTGTH